MKADTLNSFDVAMQGVCVLPICVLSLLAPNAHSLKVLEMMEKFHVVVESSIRPPI